MSQAQDIRLILGIGFSTVIRSIENVDELGYG